MDTVTEVQTLDEADCISYSTNTLGKGMNPISLPPAIGKIKGQNGFFRIGVENYQKEEKLWSQIC